MELHSSSACVWCVVCGVCVFVQLRQLLLAPSAFVAWRLQGLTETLSCRLVCVCSIGLGWVSRWSIVLYCQFGQCILVHRGSSQGVGHPCHCPVRHHLPATQSSTSFPERAVRRCAGAVCGGTESDGASWCGACPSIHFGTLGSHVCICIVSYRIVSYRT